MCSLYNVVVDSRDITAFAAMAELLSDLQHLKKFAGDTHNIRTTTLMKYMRSDIPLFFVCRAIEWTRESVRPTSFEAPGMLK
jgi:hypothetical protein